MSESQPIRLIVVGLNHKTAPLTVREAFAFDTAACRAAVAKLRESYPASEAVLVSTCNRVELYVARPLHGSPTVEEAAAFLARQRGLDPASVHGHVYRHEDRAAVEHLFSVTASLDSMVVGETQILAQVRSAYQLAAEVGSVGAPAGGPTPAGPAPSAEQDAPNSGVFHTLFQRAIAAAKDVHDKTELSSGRLSVASVAIDLARGVFDRFDDKTVVAIGAGEMVALMLTHLRELKPKKLLIANRSVERAQAVAQEFSGTAVGLDQLPELLVEADIVLTSTGSPTAVVTAEMFKGLLKRRRYRPVVMIDIAVPRDVEESVGDLPNVYLYNVDDLQEVIEATRSKRDAAVAESTALVKTHVDEFIAWFTARDVGPVVKALYAHANTVAKAELEQLFSRLPDLTDTQRAAIEKTAHRLVNKLLHTPVSKITHETEASGRPFLVAAIRKLFGL